MTNIKPARKVTEANQSSEKITDIDRIIIYMVGAGKAAELSQSGIYECQYNIALFDGS